MSEPGNFDDMRGENERADTSVDPYTTESSADIYTTPEVTIDTTGMMVDETSSAPVMDTHGLFSGNGQSSDPYSGQAGTPYGGGPNAPYGGQMYNNTYDGANNNPYYNNNYPNGSPYGNDQAQQGTVPYQNNSYDQNAAAYGADGAYNRDAYNTYGSNAYGADNAYNTGSAYGSGSPYGGNSFGGNGYGSPYNGANPYGGQQAGGYGGQPPYGNQPFYDNPYSPYAAPQEKQHTGLIITIVIIIIVLFMVAICALAYRAVQLAKKSDIDVGSYLNNDKYDFEDDYEYHYDDYDDDYFYGDDYDYDYDYDYDDDKYYSLQDDLKYDLSYEVSFDHYEYETDNENVSILVTYPIIAGEDVQNLETLNDTIYSEIELITEYFEENFAPHLEKNEDSYFSATAIGYVTYMDEDKLSIVFDERIYADTYYLAYLECFNIDMASGVVLDKEEMLSTDDDFSVEFRTRSDEQNGEIYSLTSMTDQEITGYFNSSDVIVFYTPMGMEIGFNYEDGWVTVTYEEYEKYLNVF